MVQTAANSDKVICINSFREYFPPRTIHRLHSVQNGMSRQPSFFNRTTVYKRRKLNSRTVGFPHRYLLYQNHLILSSFVLDRLNYIVYNALLLNTQLKNDEFKNISVRHMNLCTLDGVLLFSGHSI